MKKHCSNFFFPILIIILVGFLAFKNYVPGTFLSGWDTLHPEFNFQLYFERISSGVWQEHQGVGAVAAQAHAGELTRIIFPYLLSLILPLGMVRYTFLFLTLLVGALGMYFLTKYILSISFEKSIKPAAFLASIFYVLNLVTLQQFYNPLEMFTVHYATIPWLFLTAIRYLRQGKKTNILWFVIVTIFSSSIAHTATLFYAYFGILLIYLLTSVILARNREKFKRGGLLVLLTLLLNLFWLAPNIYYVLKESSTVSNSQINSTFSSEAFLQSRVFGNINDLGLFKNFPFNWREYNFVSGSFEDQMSPWISHLKMPLVPAIGYIFTIFGALGIVVASFRKSKYALSFLPVLAVCVFFLINENPPFTNIFVYLRHNIPLFSEALRFPFTKFSIILIASLSVFLAFSSQFILKFFSKLKMEFVFVALFMALSIYFMLPAFKGGLLDSSMRVKIPLEYFQMFDWFNSQDHSARVARLPIQSFWGWDYHSWGYQGAGFTWFGIPQPTLNREFDRWGLYSEDFYFQASGALYSGNADAFKNVLKKYNVKYLLLDESIINAGGSSEILYIPQIKKIITDSSGMIKEVTRFNFLTIYEINFDSGNKYIFAPGDFSNINTDMTYAKVDPIYATYGDYVGDVNGASFPFVNLDNRGDVKITVLNGDQASISANLILKNTKTSEQLYMNISNSVKADLSINNGYENIYNCDIKKSGNVYRDITSDGVLYRAEGGGVSCDYVNFIDIKYSQAYILRIKGKNLEGRSLKIYLVNHKTRKPDLEVLLPEGSFDKTYFLYPTIMDGSGYTLNFETRSYGKIASENIITGVEFYPVDYPVLASYLGKGPSLVEKVTNDVTILDIKKYGTWGYKVLTSGSGLVALGQGYEDGWVAFQMTDSKVKVLEHKLVNSWANGWNVTGVGPVYIFFWPQFLEWGGITLGVATLTLLFLKRK